MSAIYNLEPQPTASMILHTTLGELSVELFAKQTPLTCRNFLQLALDGYYDNTIFHRLVPGFIIQRGDPTGTGNGGESIYDGGAFSGDLDAWPMDQRRGKNAGPTGINFKDEFHSRLKFNRRGLLGMANESRPDTNGSQFFFTLDKADELNGKNTMFGRVGGETIYNLAKMGEAEVDESTERPLYPAVIQRVEILVNPFEDMKKRTRIATQQSSNSRPKDKKKKRKWGKQLLSFGDEEGDDDAPVLKKAKFDTRIVMEDEIAADDTLPRKPKQSKPKAKKPTELQAQDASLPKANHYAEEKSTDRQKGRSSPSPQPPREPSPEPTPKKSALELANEEMAALKASMRRSIYSEQHFIANCQSCTSWDNQEKEESDDEGWMSHALSFTAEKLGKDLSNRKKAEEELVVIDPHEKARTLKEEKRAERDARSGKSGRAWDQVRDQAKNAQMARAASLAGRGAK